MEKTFLIPILITSLFFVSCQSKSKRVAEMRKQTQIEIPFEITQAEEGESKLDAEDAKASEPTTPSAVNVHKQQDEASKSKVKEGAQAGKDSKSKAEVSKQKPSAGGSQPSSPKPVASSTSKASPSVSSGPSTKKTDQSSPVTPKGTAPQAVIGAQPGGEAKAASEDISQFPFKVGEKVTYSISFFAVEAGRMTMEVKPFKQIQNEKTYHFYVTAMTSAVFNLFYSVKDYAESFWSVKHKRPYLMKIYGEESKYVREIQASFDWPKKTARYQAKILKRGHDLEHEDKSWNLKSNKAQDVISALYNLRTFDLQVGKTYKMNVAEKGKDIVVSAEVLRKETLKTRAGTFQTLVVKPTFTVDGAWKQVGDVLIWLTDDESKIPIAFEAKVKIGTIKGRLHSLRRS